VVTDTVKAEITKADMETISDYEKYILKGNSAPEVKKIAKSFMSGVMKALEKASTKALAKIRTSLANPEIKKDNIESVKTLAGQSVKDKLAAYQQKVRNQDEKEHPKHRKEQSL